MQAHLELTKEEILQALAEYVERTTGVSIVAFNLTVETKSKQNYRSEWEQVEIRVNCQVNVRKEG